MSVPGGAVIAGYTVERVLGVGGMGTVYLARHPVLPRSDALKVLSEELSADAEFEARFLREADIAATLDHPNIVRVYTRGETEQGQLWIAMQFIDGTDAGAVSKRGPVPAQRAAHVVGQVARALDYAHARGVLHRDIKPANFLLSGEIGPRERVLLADFGIARALSEATRLTATGTLVSTVAYTAPEMLEGRNADHRADVYSLGCALYRMLTNRTPFGGDSSVSAVLVAHLTEPPPRVTATVPALPPAIDDVIAKAMAKDPNARYQSAREFAAAAARALGYPGTGQAFTQPAAVPWDNPGTQPWPRTGPVSPPPPLPTGPTSPAKAPGIRPAPPGWPGAAPAEHQPTGPTQPRAATPGGPQPRKGRRRWAYVAVVAAVVAASVGVYVYTKSPSLPPYSPQTFTHTFGVTTIDHRPNAVAALSLADADAVLSLGFQPVAIASGLGGTPNWLAALIHDHPTVVAHGDASAVKAAHPDVIIDTAANRKIYGELSALAPTVARPNDQGAPWNSRAQIDWIGRILGITDGAMKLNDRMAARQADVRQLNSGFAGKRIKIINLTDSGLTVDLSASPAAAYLSGLGFLYDADYASKTPDALEQPITGGSLFKTDDDDVTIVIRVDKKAGNGGFDGLPEELLEETTQLVVVDKPDTIAAFVSGGPAATNYLDDNFVSVLKDKVR